MKKIFLTALVLFNFSIFGQINSIYNSHTKEKLDAQVFFKELTAHQIYVLGEFHNTIEIQNAQAQFIENFIVSHPTNNDFVLHWEFLNFTENSFIKKNFQLLISNKISAHKFLEHTLGQQYMSYLPIIKSLKRLNGDINGINLPRTLKQQIIKEGIESIDPNLISPYHYVGGKNYLDRFSSVMGNHVPSYQLAKYFEVQCLVDSTMAYQIYIETIRTVIDKTHFLIAGSFHTDFFQATVEKLKRLIPKKVISFKFISKTHQTDDEIQEIVRGDKLYGAYADYIIVSD